MYSSHRKGSDLETLHEKFPLEMQVVDDVELEEIRVMRDTMCIKLVNCKARRNIEESIVVPLQLGTDKIKIAAEDWSGKTASKEITVFRKKLKPGEKPEEIATATPSARPNIDFSVSLYENKTIWQGGGKVGFIVTVENKGKGKGEVDVMLLGDEYLLKLFGKTRSLGEIEPGKTKSEVFSVDLPTEPPEKEAILYIELKEKIWGDSPLKKEELRIVLIPAGKEVSRKPLEPILPAPHAFANKRPNGYAIVVGISDYPKVDILPYPKKDAEAFVHYLTNFFGIPKKRIQTLYNEDATKSLIEASISEIMNKRPNFLVFYYSGHGSPNPEIMTDTAYIVPYDADIDRFGSKVLVPLDELVESLEATNVDTILVILDACFSGRGGKTPQYAQKVVRGPVRLPKSKKATVLSSSRENEPSLNFDEAGYSLFSYYLMLGLKKLADNKTSQDGWITIGELYDFLSDNIPENSNNKQHPNFSPEGYNKNLKLGRWR